MQMRPELGQAERLPHNSRGFLSRIPRIPAWERPRDGSRRGQSHPKWGFFGGRFPIFWTNLSLWLVDSPWSSPKIPPKIWELSQGLSTIPKVELGGKSFSTPKTFGKPQTERDQLLGNPNLVISPRFVWNIAQVTAKTPR